MGHELGMAKSLCVRCILDELNLSSGMRLEVGNDGADKLFRSRAEVGRKKIGEGHDDSLVGNVVGEFNVCLAAKFRPSLKKPSLR
jgi:hypothetical protein